MTSRKLLPFDASPFLSGNTLARANDVVNVINGDVGLIGKVGGHQYARSFPARITETPPTGRSTYADERYWVVPQLIRQGSGGDQHSRLLFVDDPDPYWADVGGRVTCNNWNESMTASHFVQEYTYVWVYTIMDNEEVSYPHHIMFVTPQTEVLVKIMSTRGTGGWYDGRILTGTSYTLADGTLAMPEGMTVPTANNCVVGNLLEEGLVGWMLSPGRTVKGTITGSTSDGKKIVFTDAIAISPTSCNPASSSSGE